MKKILYALFIMILLQSCGNKRNSDFQSYVLVPAEEKIIIPIDDSTNCYSFSIFTHTTSDNITYLTMENEQTSEINFYRLDSCKLSHKVKINQEGPNGIGHIFGHYTIDLDTILVYAVGEFSVYKINKNGDVLDKYSLQSDSDILVAHPPVSKIYNPMVKIGNKVYMYQALRHKADGYNGDDLEKYPLCIEIDLEDKHSSLLSLTYPRLWENRMKNNEFTCSRDYDGKNFVYSFYVNNYLYVTSDNERFDKYDCKSKYISGSPVFSNTNDIEKLRRENIENASYGTVVYDKFRNVYYRFFYPKCEINKNENLSVLMKTKKEFSIMVLNSDFQIVGETLFPEGQYVPDMFFIIEDGLFISDNNFNSSTFDENVLSFRKIELVKQN